MYNIRVVFKDRDRDEIFQGVDTVNKKDGYIYLGSNNGNMIVADATNILFYHVEPIVELTSPIGHVEATTNHEVYEDHA